MLYEKSTKIGITTCNCVNTNYMCYSAHQVNLAYMHDMGSIQTEEYFTTNYLLNFDNITSVTNFLKAYESCKSTGFLSRKGVIFN